MTVKFFFRFLRDNIAVCFIAPLCFVFFFFLLPHYTSAEQENFKYATYRDLPGITSEEIDAIERLRRNRTHLVYGVEASSELFRASDGTLGGYGVLLCDWLSSFLEIRFTPAIYEWDDLIKDLASHEVDFTGELTPTPERLAIYRMTSPISERTLKYFRLAGSRNLQDIAEFRPLRYGYAIGTTTFDQVESSLEKPFETFQVANHEMAYRMLKNNDIDAFLEEAPYEAAFDAYGDIVTEDILPMVFVPVSLATQNPALAPVISVVQKALDNGGLQHLNNLHRQGHHEYLRHKFLFGLTQEEREYVHAHSKYGRNIPILIGMECDNYPIAFYNDREEAWQGCAVDILEAVGNVSGLNFTHAFKTPILWPEVLRMLENGELALISELVKTPEREGHFLWPDKPFMVDSYALISRSNYPDVELSDVRYLTVGLAKGTAFAEVFRQLFPEHKLTKQYNGMLEPLYALERGEVDLAMGSHNQLHSMTNYLERPYFKINVSLSRKFESYFGINKSENILCSIISKGTRLVNTDAIAERWKRRVFDYKGAVARARMPYMFTGMFLFFCVIVLLSVMFFKSKKAEKKLEAAVEERTRELQYQTHVAAQAVKAKSDFLARVSHEIRTPMNAIIGMAELAQRELPSIDAVQGEVALRKPAMSKLLEYISGIKAAGASLLTIINDILDLSKIESGNFPIYPAPYETSSLLNDVLTVIRVNLAKTSLELILDVSAEMPGRLTGDAGRIKQILHNLLSNAMKYAKKGYIKFSASGEPLSANTVRLTFIVEDSGIGIKEEDLPRLFAEFTRFDEVSNRGIMGTGLGLAIARRLCLLMGGDITVRSEYGKGTVFTVTLEQSVVDWKPMGDVADKAAARAEPQHISFVATEAEVLVVDDFPSNLLVAEGLLIPYRVHVHTCATGREAVDMVHARPYDLVLMDHMMPEMDGVEAVGIIRAMPEDRFRTMPIVALTANAVSGMKEMFLECGFNDFLSKPIEPAKLDALLQKWIPEDKRQKTESSEPESRESSQPPEILVSEIDGVDVADGIAHVGGSRDLYLELLEVFLSDVEAGLSLLESEPNAHTMRSFTIQVHALKSATANIGAHRLSQTAALLEAASREADMSAIRDNLSPFREELIALTTRIGAALKSVRDGDCKRQDEPKIEKELACLQEALQEAEIDAIDAALARLRALPLTGRTHIAISEIANFILLGEFQKAAEAVTGLRRQSDVPKSEAGKTLL